MNDHQKTALDEELIKFSNHPHKHAKNTIQNATNRFNPIDDDPHGKKTHLSKLELQNLELENEMRAVNNAQKKQLSNNRALDRANPKKSPRHGFFNLNNADENGFFTIHNVM